MHLLVWSDFLKLLALNVVQYVTPFVLPVACAIVFIAVLKFLAWRKADLGVVEMYLRIIKNNLGNALGDKADAVFTILLDALDKIKDGELSPEEMVEEFVAFVKATLQGQSVTLTPEEEAAVVDAAKTTVEMATLKKSSTQTVVKAMMAEARVMSEK